MDVEQQNPARSEDAALRGLGRAMRWVADYALPPRCPVCGTVVEADRQLCMPCWSTLHFLDGPACARCSVPLNGTIVDGEAECGACLIEPPPFDGAPAAVAYGAAARTVAMRLKYGRRTGHARLMAQLMARPLKQLVGQGGALLLPVPLHRWRLWSRGFNQAALIADALTQLTGVPHQHRLLLRRKATESLRGKSRRERDKIVSGAFALAPGAQEAIAGRHVILVDDVHASGATLKAAARALRRSGAARISALTWARVVPDAMGGEAEFDIAALDSDIGSISMTG